MSGPLTPEKFDELAVYTEELLGSHLTKQHSSYLRAKQSGNNQYKYHRLAYLYDRMLEAKITTKQTPPSGDLAAVVELAVFKSLVEEFESEEGWNEIKSELNSPTSFVHLMNMLIFIKMQRGLGGNCTFVTSNSTSKKSADIVMYTPLKDKINVEVKCPEILIQAIDLTDEQMDRIIERSWKKASKQLKPEPSILLIGGVHIPIKIMNKLQNFAQSFLDSKENLNVAYIRIQSVSIKVENPIFNENGGWAMGKGTSLQPQINFRQAKNKSYKGIVQFNPSNKVSNGFSKSENPTKSMTLDKDKIIRIENNE